MECIRRKNHVLLRRPYPRQHALEPGPRSLQLWMFPSELFPQGCYPRQCATPRMQSPALQDISKRSVGSREFLIAQEDVVQCLAACKSWRNLAAQLANKLGCNCRGACGKTALNYFKDQEIFVTCFKYYPLDRLEMGATAEREMRNTID